MGSLFDWFGSGSSSNSSTQTKLNKLEKEIEVIKASISSKVDKIQGKGLSTNDFTNEYKNKLEEIYWNIADDRTVMERPKVLYNEKTGNREKCRHSKPGNSVHRNFKISTNERNMYANNKE